MDRRASRRGRNDAAVAAGGARRSTRARMTSSCRRCRWRSSSPERALARRSGGFAAQALPWGDVTLDTQTFELRTAADRVHLGNREYQIIELLMRGRGAADRRGGNRPARLGRGKRGQRIDLGAHLRPAGKAGSNRGAGENPHLSRAGIRAGGLKPIILPLKKITDLFF